MLQGCTRTGTVSSQYQQVRHGGTQEQGRTLLSCLLGLLCLSKYNNNCYCSYSLCATNYYALNINERQPLKIKLSINVSLLLIQGTSRDVGTSTEDLLTSRDASTQTDECPTPNHEEDDSDATIDYSYQASQSPVTCNSPSSSGSYTDVYELDNDYDGPAYPSQPVIGGKHGASYTPPGWKHRLVKRKRLNFEYERDKESEAKDTESDSSDKA